MDYLKTDERKLPCVICDVCITFKSNFTGNFALNYTQKRSIKSTVHLWSSSWMENNNVASFSWYTFIKVKQKYRLVQIACQAILTLDRESKYASLHKNGNAVYVKKCSVIVS